MNNSIEEVQIVKDKRVQPIAQVNTDHNAFFTKLIVEDGLTDFHITVQSGLSDETKVKLIQQEIQNWDVKGEPITNL